MPDATPAPSQRLVSVDALRGLDMLMIAGLGAAASGLSAPQAFAQAVRPQKFEPSQLIDSGHQFFGTISRGLGQAVGPDLSHIGRIRSPRDLLESILFPSATIARDYETHLIETADRQTIMGTIQSDTSEALVVLGAGGERRTLPRRQVVAINPSSTSMMPAGLELGRAHV